MAEKNNQNKHPFLTLFIVGYLLIGIFFVFIYRRANSVQVVAYPDTSQYAVYDGKNVNEYWKTTLNDNQQVLYEEMKEAYLQFLEYFSTRAESMTEEEFNEVYVAVLLDHPEIFWMNSYQVIVKPFSDMVNVNKNIKLFYYYTKDEAKEVKDRIEPKINQIVEEASKLDTDYDKILYVHDTIIDNTEYEDGDTSDRKFFQTIVSILETNKSVCAGYTYTFKIIMDRLGIESISIRDVGNDFEDDNHIWNMVKHDGIWYNIDVTWDDVLYNREDIRYYYFFKDNETFYKTHDIQKNMPS